MKGNEGRKGDKERNFAGTRDTVWWEWFLRSRRSVRVADLSDGVRRTHAIFFLGNDRPMA